MLLCLAFVLALVPGLAIAATESLRHGFLLVVPEFSAEDFPKSRKYNLGNVFTRDGLPSPVSTWSFTAIEKLFDAIRHRYNMTAVNYGLYGHSFGSGFVAGETGILLDNQIRNFSYSGGPDHPKQLSAVYIPSLLPGTE